MDKGLENGKLAAKSNEKGAKQYRLRQQSQKEEGEDMKFNRSILIAVGTLTFAVVLTFGVSKNAPVSAQQMQDLPYDLHFIDMMIMHHQEGIEMAQLAETKAQKAGVKASAKKTAAEQQKDIEELQGHRNHFYAGKPPMDSSMMESMMQSMHGGMMMNMEDTRRKLLAAQGAAFDRLFLDTMIHHHQMAVVVAKEATTKAENAELKEYARKAVTKQQSEIAEMNQLKGVRNSTKPKSKTTHKHTH